ncbi:MAG: hypothetical protein IPO80_04790 [Propionibacteriaceae bacterium]|nr:hypothetical protein [Propionibacteriaceae bacterium]
MIPAWNTAAGRARGWQVARWLQKNAATLKVKYIIFDMKVWRAYRSSQGWQPYTPRHGSPSRPSATMTTFTSASLSNHSSIR